MADRRPQLASMLIRKTEAEAIKWQNGPSEDSVIAILGKGRVVVSKEEISTNYLITIRVYDPNGEIIETFNDEDLEVIDSNLWYPRLNQMLKNALRAASGADAKLAEIIDELSDDDLPF